MHFQECLNSLMQAHSWRKYPGGATPVIAITFKGAKYIFYLLNVNVNSFLLGQPMPLHARYDAGCRIVEWTKMMLGAELPSATIGFS